MKLINYSQLQLTWSAKLSVCSYVPILFKNREIIFFKNFHGLLGHWLGGNKLKKFFSLVTFLREGILGYSLSILVYYYFFMFIYFLRIIQHFLMEFCIDIFCITSWCPLLDSILCYFGLILAFVPLFFESCSIFSHVLDIILIVLSLKNASPHVSFYFGLLRGIFWPNLAYVSLFLGSYSIFPHEKKSLFTSCFPLLGAFWVIFGSILGSISSFLENNLVFSH